MLANQNKERIHILYIEDDIGLARLLQRRLQRIGYKIAIAHTAKEGIEHCRNTLFDMVLIDYHLPDCDGLELMRQVIAIPNHTPPIIFITGAGTEKVAVDAMHLGAQDYLVKDPDGAYLDLLPTVIERVLDRHRLLAAKQQADLALRKERDFSSAVINTAGALVMVLDPKGNIVRFNRSCEQMTGYGFEEVKNRPFWDLLLPVEELESTKAAFQRIIKGEFPSEYQNHWVNKKGSQHLIKWSNTALVRDDSTVEYVICTGIDITESHRLAQQMSYQATHDGLTGLVNRHEFERRLQRVLTTTRTDQTNHALCYLDLDQFKVINDICGHFAGDELLRQVAGLLPKQIRTRDTVARLGGDEFGILMEHCSLEQAKRGAEALRKALEEFRFLWENKNFSIGVSIGLVPITEHSENIKTVLSAADAACYMAKDMGRNRVHIYQEDNGELLRRQGESQWAVQINQALEENRFRLSVQPIVPVEEHNNQLGHYELLLRMEDEQGQLIPPGAFLPTAERYNLSTKLDRWVIGKAFDWIGDHLDELRLCSINLSGYSLMDEEFLDLVLKQFQEASIPPEKICLEIAETAVITNFSNALHFITALKSLGCHFLLDHFGSGLSSFTYLKTLPIDFLKIDGLFVKGIVDNPVDLAIVSAINEIGHLLDKKTIAEFVENRDILKKLREIGVDYAQGYGISHPKPIREIATLQTWS